MQRRLARAAAGLGAILLAVGCCARPDGLGGSTASVGPEPYGVVATWPGESTVALNDETAGTWWPVSSTTELVPTGIEVVASSTVDSMVVDGTGAAWLHSVGKVTRVHPSTGSAESWDIGDDAALGTVTGLRQSREGGVWLVSEGRLRLFDGHRYVRDIPVPAELRGGDVLGITDMVEVGSEIWVSSAAGVARCAGGAWSPVGAGQLTRARTLAADPAGHVWAVGMVREGQPLRESVTRFDGARWSTPQPWKTRSGDLVLADPTGGFLVRVGADLHHFDGLTWRRLPDVEALLDPLAVPVVPSLSPDGVVWLRGADFLAKEESGRWRRVATHESLDLVQMAFTGADVLVADSRGLLRLVGDRLTRVWVDREVWLGASPARLMAVTFGEAWAIGTHRGGPNAILRFSDGSWQEMSPGAGPVGLAVATDGAVWMSTEDGLIRSLDGQQETVDGNLLGGSILAGPAGGVWAPQPTLQGGCWAQEIPQPVLEFRYLTLVKPDGQRTSLPLPVGDRPVTSIVAGADGSVWTTTCRAGIRDGGPMAPTLSRWRGEWSPVPYPGPSLIGIAGDPRGGLWAWLGAVGALDVPTLARYADGTWTQYPQVPALLSTAATPGGSICAIAKVGLALLCVETSGRITSTPLGIPAELSIGLDGSVWLTDPARSGVVARWPGRIQP